MTKTQETACRKRTYKRLHDILTSKFDSANLLTLEYAQAIPVSREFEKKQYASWLHLARRLAGGSFEYVKITEYGAASAPVIRHRMITNLPAETCAALSDSWFMGSATVEPLSADQLASIAETMMQLPADGRERCRRAWITSQHLVRPAAG